MTISPIFVRDELGQIPGQSPGGFSESPDILFSGKGSVQDPSVFTTPDSYAQAGSSTVYINQNNYVYLRGLNTTQTPQTSHMFFYYTPSSLMLWPANWQSSNITVNGLDQNWSLLTAPPLSSGVSGVGVTTAPFKWVPPPLPDDPGNHYCTIAWSDNNPTTPTPPDLAAFGAFQTVDELAAFVISHTQMGWRNTYDVYGSPPTYTYNSPISFQAAGGNIAISVQFFDVPLDGTFSVVMPSDGKNPGINLIDANISKYEGGFNTNYMSFLPNYATNLAVTWTKGQINPPPTAYVSVSVVQLLSDYFINLMVKAGISLGQIPVQLYQPNYPHGSGGSFRPTPVVVVGAQTWCMKYGQTPPSTSSPAMLKGKKI